MESELSEFLRQGDDDLCRTCGETVTYTSRAGGRVFRLPAVVGAAPIEYVTEGPGGQQMVCTRAVDISALQLTDGLRPAIGDRIRTTGGELLLVVRITASSYDTSVHLGCTVIT